RSLYARSLAAGINHYNQGEIIAHLLATGRDATASERREEGKLIAAALRALPTHRAYHILEAIRARRINNRRARAIVRDFLASRRDLGFEAVKYRRAIRAAAVHAHLRLPGEAGLFLFRGVREARYEAPLFEAFRQAHFSAKAIYELPFSIAEGLAERR